MDIRLPGNNRVISINPKSFAFDSNDNKSFNGHKKVVEKFASIVPSGCAGCQSSECCKQIVFVDILEASIINHFTSDISNETLETAFALDNIKLDNTQYRNGPCPLLDTNNRCSIYDHRPIECAMHCIPPNFAHDECFKPKPAKMISLLAAAFQLQLREAIESSTGIPKEMSFAGLPGALLWLRGVIDVVPIAYVDDRGVFYSRNCGKIWKEINLGLEFPK